MAMIIITHDMGVVAEAADDIVVMYAGQIVEHASTLELFDHPEHPYTEALLGALPQLEGEGIREGRLTAIPGRPPDLIDPPVACRFAARCRYAGRRLLHRADAGAARGPAGPLGPLRAPGERASCAPRAGGDARMSTDGAAPRGHATSTSTSRSRRGC